VIESIRPIRSIDAYDRSTHTIDPTHTIESNRTRSIEPDRSNPIEPDRIRSIDAFRVDPSSVTDA